MIKFVENYFFLENYGTLEGVAVCHKQTDSRLVFTSNNALYHLITWPPACWTLNQQTLIYKLSSSYYIHLLSKAVCLFKY